MYRRLFLAILILMLPLQSYAGTMMIRCALAQHQQAPRAAADMDSAHRHHGSAAARDAATGVDAHRDHAMAFGSGAGAGHDHGLQHSSGSDLSHHGDKPDCCATTVAIATSLAFSFPAAGSPVALTYVAGALPSVFLEGLRRPPRAFAA